MATVQQFIHWLKREKSKGGCIKMASPEMNPSHDSSSDDSYGMKRLLKRETRMETSKQNEQFIEQFSSAPCRASMKLPPIPREEGRARWMPSSSRRICSDSPAHIYEEIPWSAVETDYEDGPDDNANQKNQTDRNTTDSQSNTSNSQTNIMVNQGCEPYLVVQLTNSKKQQNLSNQTCAKTDQTVEIAQNSSGDCKDLETTCIEHLLADDGLEKYAGNFVQCTKCNRPHGLFNGTQIKHFDDHNEHGDADMCTFDRLSVRTRSMGQVQTTSNNNTKHGFQREVPSNKFGPKVRTNPRVSERNFKFTRSTSSDGSRNNCNVPSSVDGGTQPMGSNTNSHVIKVQESDSADTCNEYDIQTGSELASGKSGSSGGSNQSKRSSIASDSAASNLYGSESSNDSLNSHSRQISRERTKLNESDSSNDTFSEYDIRSSDSYSSSKGMGDEYDFYLNKIRQNLMLKHDTLRVIRESESSEYETSEYQSSSMGSSVYTSSDVSIMTSLGNTDVGNCSAFNENRDVQLKGILKNSSKSFTALPSRPKRSIVIKDELSKSKSGSHVSNPSVHVRKKPNRRKSTGTIPNTLECYTLPDFSSDTSSTISDGIKVSNSPADSSVLDSSLVSNSSGSDSDILDRLSCRATNYKPGTPPLTTPSSGSSVSSLGGGASAFTKVGSSKVTVPKVTSAVVTRAPARAHSQARSQHNRLLTDIMKLNHDRQLLFL